MKPEFLKKIKSGELTVEDANLNLLHEIWTRLSAILNFFYMRI